jgi:hypothetical protein
MPRARRRYRRREGLLGTEPWQMRETMAMHGDMMRHTAADAPAIEDDHSARHSQQ